MSLSIPPLPPLPPIPVLLPLPIPVPTLPLPPIVLPTLPQVVLNAPYTPPVGHTFMPLTTLDLQVALLAAQPGDTIILQAGTNYVGPFTLPNKAGTGWIYIVSSALGSLPPSGTRVDPAQAPFMPKILSTSEFNAGIQTASGAHHYRLVGIEFHPTAGTMVRSQIRFGNGESALSLLPHDLVVDRCYIHGDPTIGGFRGIELNSTRTIVVDSYIADFKHTVWDTQAIWEWNGPGPFKIVNNYLESAGENIMFGGQDPAITNLVASDIEIRGNHCVKPLAWQVGNPAYAGTHWVIKNLLEFKNAQRVLVDGNVFEQIWADNPVGQDGFAIFINPRNQGGGSPWAVVQDIAFTHNIVQHARGGIVVSGQDNVNPSQQTKRILVQNNLFTDIGAYPLTPSSAFVAGEFLVMGNGSPLEVTLDHNTAFHSNDPVVNTTYPASPNAFTFTNNIVMNGPDGIAWALLGPGLTFLRNLILDGTAGNYPPNNFFAPSAIPIVKAASGGSDFSLVAGSPYAGAGTDGKDVGVDFPALSIATATVLTGVGSPPPPSPPPPPPPSSWTGLVTVTVTATGLHIAGDLVPGP